MNKEFVRLLEQYLKGQLPGKEAHLKLAPLNRPLKPSLNQSFSTIKEGSVLILLYPVKGDIFLPLMQRPNYDGIHSGQISLPGGKKEMSDQDLIATALRESMEEIGVLEQEVKIIGTLTEVFIPVSNFKVLPVIGYMDNRPYFLPDEYEVVKIIEASIKELLQETSVKSKIITTSSGLELNAPYYDVQGHIVWGATAMILCELLTIVSKIKTW
jgi:8-oxo-dGTP pyrophosphatase MutT (NUDIX family)